MHSELLSLSEISLDDDSVFKSKRKPCKKKGLSMCREITVALQLDADFDVSSIIRRNRPASERSLYTWLIDATTEALVHPQCLD